MDLKRNKPAVDFLFAGYSLIAGIIWWVRAADLPAFPLALAGHLAAAAVLVLLPGCGHRPRRAVMVARSVYPFVLWAAAWAEIGWLFTATGPAVFDALVMKADRVLFGTHWNEHLAGHWPWLRDIMGLSYLSYYLLILGPPLLLAATRRFREFQRYITALMATYLACFAVYLMFPVLGPRDLSHAVGQPARTVGGIFGPVIEAFFAAGDSLGTAFPSSHCAGSVATALLVTWFFGSRRGRVAAAWAALIVLSTIYTNNHYTIDAAAGTALALAAVGLVRFGSRPGAKAAAGGASLVRLGRIPCPGVGTVDSRGGLS